MKIQAQIGPRIGLLALAVGLFGLDRWTKTLISNGMELYSSEAIIGGFFNLVHARNTGIAFSLLNDAGPLVKQYLLPGFSALAVVAILILFWKSGTGGWKVNLSLALILSGAAGNLYDRLVYGYVVDFLDFYVGTWHWPAFNVADSCITVGAALLLLDSFSRQEQTASAKEARTA